MNSKIEIKYLIFISVLALFIRAWGINFGLPFIYNIDEEQIVPAALRFGTGDLNPHNFVYPPLFKYLLFVFYGFYFVIGYMTGSFSSLTDFKIMYFNDPAPFYLIGRFLSVLMGTLTVIVVYLLGKKAYNKASGVIASLFVMSYSLHISYSRVALTDVTMTLFVLLSVYFIYEISQNGFLKNYILAGIFGGLAITTKYNAGLIVVSILAVHIMNLWENNKKFNLKPLFLSYIALVGAFLIFNPFALLDFQSFIRDIKFNSLVSSSSGNIFTGLIAYLRALFLPRTFSEIGNYFGIFALGGIIYALYRRTKTDLILLLYPVIHLLFMSYKTANHIKPVYVLPAMLLFYLFGARFLVDIVNKTKFSTKKKYILLSLTIFIFLVHPIKDVVKMFYLVSQKDTATLAREWIEENIPANSKILYTDYHNLGLKKNKDSLTQQFKLRQEIAQKYSVINQEFLNEKIKAISLGKGPLYYIYRLPQSWGELTYQKVEQLGGKLPPGATTVDLEKISLEYWRDKKIEYIVVFPHQIEKYFTEDGKTKYPNHFSFFSKLFTIGKLLKKFTPDPPYRPGYAIEIYRIFESTQNADS